MARPRKPTAVLEMTGAFKHNPSRRREPAKGAKPDGAIGPPPPSFLKPSSFGNRLVEIWNEYIAEAPPGLLTISDRKQLESLCRVTAECERIGAKPAWFAAQERLLKSFCMNPVARAQRDVPVEQPKDDFEQFMRAGSRRAG